MLKKASCLLLLFLFLSSLQVLGQITVIPDSALKEVRKPTVEEVETFLSDPRFDYEEARSDAETLWERFKRWVFQNIIEFLSRPGVETVLKIIFYIIIGLVVIALIRQFIQGDISNAFFGNSGASRNRLRYSTSDIASVDFDSLLKAAIERHDYKEAVNILYNKALQQLNGKELIEWASDKTNHDYLFELKSSKVQPVFAEMTYIYDYVEYGDFPVDEAEFKQIRQTFNQLDGYLKNE